MYVLDHSFQLGTIESNYQDLFDNSVCKALATASCLESSPLCSDCVFSPFCGTCPVLNYYENNNLFALNPSDYKCQIYKGMLKTLFSLLNSGDEEIVGILKKWCNCNYWALLKSIGVVCYVGTIKGLSQNATCRLRQSLCKRQSKRRLAVNWIG